MKDAATAGFGGQLFQTEAKNPDTVKAGQAPDFEQANAAWQDFLVTLRNYRLFIISVLVVTVLSTYVVLQAMTELYEVKAQLLVKLGRENVEIPVTASRSGFVSSGVRKEEINSYVQLLLSPALLRATVDSIGLEAFEVKPPPATTPLQKIKRAMKDVGRFLWEAVERVLISLNLTKELSKREKILLNLEKKLHVAAERESDVITVSLSYPLPELCFRILDRLIGIYLDRHVEVRGDTDVLPLLEKEVDHNSHRMAKYETARREVRDRLRLNDVTRERALLLERKNDLSKLAEEAERQKTMFLDRGARESRGEALPPNLPDNVKAYLTELRAKRERLLQTYDRSNQQIVNLDREIASLEVSALAGINGQLAKLRVQMENIDARLTELNIGEDELISIEREQSLATQNYLDYSKRREDARVRAELDRHRIANIAILSPPVMPIVPVAPKRLLFSLAALPVGLILGLAFALVADYLNDRVRTERDLCEIRGLNYLGKFDARHG